MSDYKTIKKELKNVTFSSDYLVKNKKAQISIEKYEDGIPEEFDDEEIIRLISNFHFYKDSADVLVSPLMLINEENRNSVFNLFLDEIGILKLSVSKIDILAFMALTPSLNSAEILWSKQKVEDLTDLFNKEEIMEITGLDFFQSIFCYATGFKLSYSFIPINKLQRDELADNFFVMRNVYVSLFLYSMVEELTVSIDHPFDKIISFHNSLLVQYIIEFNSDPDKIIDMLKMAPYNDNESDIDDYFYRSVYLYDKLTSKRNSDFIIYAPITEEKELDMMTDKEILKYIFEGSSVKYYYSRNDILSLAKERMKNERWSRFSIGYCQNNNRDSSRESRSIPSKEDLEDSSWVSYGKPLNYYCYRLSLYNSKYWKLSEIKKRGFFERYDYNENETDRYLTKSALLKLLEFIPILEEEDKLNLDNIKESIKYAAERMKTDTSIVVISDKSIKEYIQYSISRMFFDKLKGRETDDKIVSDLKSSCEKYLLSKANETLHLKNDNDRIKDMSIFNRSIDKIDIRFIDEVNKVAKNRIDEKFIKSFHSDIENKLKGFDNTKEALLTMPISYDNNYINWLIFSVSDKNVKLSQLIEKAGIINTVDMLLRYESLMPRDENIGIPFSVAEYLYFKQKVRYEAFASPANSRFMYYPDCHFYSLFKDVDEPFGSRGDFFDSKDRYNDNIIINPPYIEELLSKAADKTIDILSKNKIVVYFFGPTWKDADYYKILNSNKGYFKTLVDIPNDKFFFEDNVGNKLESKDNISLFILSSIDNDNEDYSVISNNIIDLGKKIEIAKEIEVKQFKSNIRVSGGYRGRGSYRGGSSSYRGRGSYSGSRGNSSGSSRGSSRGRGSYRGRGNVSGSSEKETEKYKIIRKVI